MIFIGFFSNKDLIGLGLCSDEFEIRSAGNFAEFSWNFYYLLLIIVRRYLKTREQPHLVIFSLFSITLNFLIILAFI